MALTYLVLLVLVGGTLPAVVRSLLPPLPRGGGGGGGGASAMASFP